MQVQDDSEGSGTPENGKGDRPISTQRLRQSTLGEYREYQPIVDYLHRTHKLSRDDKDE